jgi:ACS family pantothenate transporter-like MFS transporter
MSAVTKEIINVADEEYPHGAGSPAHPRSQNSGPATTVGTVAKDPTLTQTWRSYVWDTLDKKPKERRFLFKLDAIVLTVACLGSFIKYLDQINVLSAFVSGMKEDLGLYQNQLNYLVTAWTVGYVVGQIPSNLILTRIRPSIWIPACEVTWSVLTILMVTCKSITGMYALRFFIGLTEACFNPATLYILGSWYRRDELAKRSCIFQASSFVGAMFSGYLMTATYRLDGVQGFKGWQWLFIINFVISMPVAIANFILNPDLPENTRAWWLSKEDVALAQERMLLEERAVRKPYTRQKFKKIFSSWHIYVLTLMYVLYNNNGNYGGQPGFQLWLKSEHYSVDAVNTYPTIALALAVVFALVFGWTSDSLWRGARWPPIIAAGAANIVINASLAAWNIPLGWKWACYIMGGLPNGLGALLMSWANEVCSSDSEERAFVVATMNTMGSAVQAWLPLLIWKQTDAPRYHKGFMSMVFIAIALMASTLLTRFLQKREAAEKESQRLSEPV